MSHDPLLLGLDVGTTQTKVGVFHLDGRPAAIAAAPYPLAFDAPTSAAEQNPTDWWTATVQALRQVLAGIDARGLLALSVGGQGPTVVPIDEFLNPAGAALTWMDRRASHEVQLLSDRVGRSLPSHAFIPKVMWLKKYRPDTFAATRWFGQSWDFVAAQLSGEAVVSMSPSIAPWSNDLLAASKLDGAKFPPLQLMASQIGRVTAKAAQITGLPEGLPIIGGISDYFESLIGSGTLQRGNACDNGGTSESLNVCWDAAVDIKGAFCLPSFVDGYWYIGGPASTTGKALEWWREQVGGQTTDDWQILESVESISPGSEDLIFLPYLAGERVPIWDPDARGVFFGLSLSHRREHMTRAILESVAYVLCHIIEHIEEAGAEVQEIHVCGGQAKSKVWCQIKADATGRRVIMPEVTDAAVLGAAIIAGIGVGAFEDYESGAKKMVRQHAIIEPDKANHERYQSLYAIYRDLYPALKSFYERLSNLN